MPKPRAKSEQLPDFICFGPCEGEPAALLTLQAAADCRTSVTASDGDAAGGGDPPAVPKSSDPPAKSKLRKFDMVAYTGGKMRVSPFPLPVVVDIAGMRIAKAVPILKNHDLNAPVGHTEAIKAANSVRASGTVSAANSHAQEVTDASDNGFPWQASIGAQIEDLQKVEKGEKILANGRQFNGPLYFAKKSTLREISVTPVGGDENSSTRVAASHSLSQNTLLQPTAPMNFEDWIKAKGFEIATLSDDQKANLQAMFDAQIAAEEKAERKAAKKAKKGKKKPATVLATASGAPTDPNEDDDDDDDDDLELTRTIRATAAAEIKRVAAVRKICTGNADLEVRAVADGWDEQRAELEMLRASRASGGSGPAIHVNGRNGTAITPQIIEASLALGHGLRVEAAAEHYDEQTLHAAMSRPMRGIGLHYLFHQVIQAAGMYAPAGRFTDDSIRTAFEAEKRIQATFPNQDFIYAAGEFSTTSLSGVLSNLANKMLLQSFTAVNAVGPKVCGVRDAVDFKPTNTYRLTEAGLLEKVGPDGELKHAQLTDESFSNQVATYGKIIALTRQQIINDDLGAFLQIPKLLGRASALALESAIFTLLLSNPNSADGNALFSAAHKNYQSGGSTALDIDSLTAAEILFLNQVDSASQPVVLGARYLLVPTQLKTLAGQMYGDSVLVGVPANNKLKSASNPHVGKWEPLSSPYLSAQGLSGQSSTGWYLLADPDEVAVVEIAYLRGSKAPTIESAETVFNTLGMQWRAFFDFGVKDQDFRGGVLSAGA